MNAPGRLVFPASARLRSRSEFEQVRFHGENKMGRMFRLASFKTGHNEPARIGIITSLRVGSAVVRSRVRRRLREIFRLHRDAIQEGVWIVVIARASAARANYADLLAEWMRLARQLDILKETP